MKKVIDYDSDNDILYVNKGIKVKDSIQMGDFIVDFSYKDEIVGLEVMNASDSISFLLDEDVGGDLKNLKDAKIMIRKGKDAIFLVLVMFFEKDEELKKPISLTLPSSV